ncbi:hypothetical protein TYRP_017336 [Tyrophagus putrescentiae]|nr:hypothetical protein TYRP_017336 [Tyrophagus putrescentiae]
MARGGKGAASRRASKWAEVCSTATAKRASGDSVEGLVCLPGLLDLQHLKMTAWPLRFDLGTAEENPQPLECGALEQSDLWCVGRWRLAFAQHGATVYCMNALAVSLETQYSLVTLLKVVNNHLCAGPSSLRCDL